MRKDSGDPEFLRFLPGIEHCGMAADLSCKHDRPFPCGPLEYGKVSVFNLLLRKYEKLRCIDYGLPLRFYSISISLMLRMLDREWDDL
ncbi:hypothetical protein ES703_56588 [subsurface metagenome]